MTATKALEIYHDDLFELFWETPELTKKERQYIQLQYNKTMEVLFPHRFCSILEIANSD